MSMKKEDIITLIKTKTVHEWNHLMECEHLFGPGDVETKKARAKWGAYSDLLEEVTGYEHFYVNGELVPEYRL